MLKQKANLNCTIGVWLINQGVMKYIFIFLSLLLISCDNNEGPKTEPDDDNTDVQLESDPALDYISLPDGFIIQTYAEGIENARSMAFAEDGTLVVGSRREHVHAMRDLDNDGRVDTVFRILDGLKMPNGVAFKDGDLYVAEINRVLKLANFTDNLADDMSYEVVFDGYPSETHHGWKFISFGPDGQLYVPVGAPCNICESEDEIFNTITKLNVETGKMEIVQRGIRNTVGFNWHPENNQLWFTDNGGDNLGDNVPGDELNYAPEAGMHFGYPYCHQGDFPDPTYGEDRNCDEFVPPAQVLGPHVAALGMEFSNDTAFPISLNDKVFIAEHGSWNRTDPIGYRITSVDVQPDGTASNYEVWIDGFRNEETGEVLGRPVDLEWMPDGSLLISDDYAGKIYRVIYTGS